LVIEPPFWLAARLDGDGAQGAPPLLLATADEVID
jgi:hypothetical protein